MMIQTTSILIVHRSQVFSRGLHALLAQTVHMYVIGDEADPESVLACVQTKHPDVVLFDGTLLPTLLDTIELATHIRRLGKCALFVFAPDAYAVEDVFLLPFVQIGAVACELPSIAPHALIEKIQRIARGEYLISRDLLSAHPLAFEGSPQCSSSSMQEPIKKRQEAYQISERGVELLRWAMNGYSNKEIAEECKISAQTVKNHFTEIFRHLGASGRTSAVAIALRYGLLSLEDVHVSEHIRQRGICLGKTYHCATTYRDEGGTGTRRERKC